MEGRDEGRHRKGTYHEFKFDLYRRSCSRRTTHQDVISTRKDLNIARVSEFVLF